MKKRNGAPAASAVGAPISWPPAVPPFRDVEPGPQARRFDCPGYSPEPGALMACPREVKLAITCPTCNDTGKTTAGKLRALGERFRGK